jgi:protein-tyrosine-phosphatase
MNILFVCRHNRFRSKIAEAYFNKINRNKFIHVKSAGVIVGRKIDKKEFQVGEERKLGIFVRGQPRALTSELVEWADIIVIVADNVPRSLFNNLERDRVRVWRVRDAPNSDRIGIDGAIGEIMGRVESLVSELEGVK